MTSKEKLFSLLSKMIPCNKSKPCTECEYSYDYDKCNEYLSGIFMDYLLMNGVKVLLCNIGDIIYRFDRAEDKIFESKISHIAYNSDTGEFVYHYDESLIKDACYSRLFVETDIGKSIFFTREEAEKALKEKERKE